MKRTDPALSRSTTAPDPAPEDRVLDAVVVGAGQAGLATAYHLRRRGLDHVVDRKSVV